MKTARLIAGCIAIVLALSACNKPDNSVPTPGPVPTVSESLNTIEPEPNTAEPQPEETTVRPTPSAITSEAGTPANQFAQRWGLRYPAVPEYAILKAANGVCVIIEQSPEWTSNPLAVAGITEVVTSFGFNENDAVEFAQDAQQNYCSSVSNPT